MLRFSTEFLLVLFALRFLLTFGQPMEDVEVITNSSACSTTCGQGIKKQTLCKLAPVQNTEEDTKVEDVCRVRSVRCLASWQCGLRTLTVTVGERLEMDCLEDMKTNGKFSARIKWRYARGLITSDGSLFVRFKTLHFDRVILDPVREEDAGTYSCEVQDASHHRVKGIYFGIRVLAVGVVNLGYEGSRYEWDQPGKKQEQQTLPQVHYTVVLSVGVAVIVVVALGLCFVLQKRRK